MADQPEAGPSTPRVPPETPTTKSRRRSWFGFGPSAVTSSPQPDPTSTSASPSRRRLFTENDKVDLLDGSSSDSAGTSLLLRRTSSSQVSIDGSDKDGMNQGDLEEVLSIDGEPDVRASGTLKAKKRTSRVGDRSEGEVVRMDDLVKLRKASSKSTMRPNQHLEALSNAEVSVSSLSPLPPEPVDTNLSRITSPSRRRLPLSPRLSSLTDPLTLSLAHKSTPPLLTERPLPALPAVSTSPPAMPSPAHLRPTDIVITPSSPRKLQKSPARHPSHTVSRRASADTLTAKKATLNPIATVSAAQSSSRSSSADGRSLNRKSSKIGLGLPASLWNTKDGVPPPLPSKTHSVSSPHPSRSSSPVPKVAFTESAVADDHGEGERGRRETRGQDEEKRSHAKVKRATSLSTLFTKAQASTQTSQSGEEARPMPPSKEPHAAVLSEKPESLISATTEIPAQQSVGKVAGMLEWLGMRKSSKRRLSEAIPAQKESPGDQGDNVEAGGARQSDSTAEKGLSRGSSDPVSDDAVEGAAFSDPGTSRKFSEVQGETAPARTSLWNKRASKMPTPAVASSSSIPRPIPILTNKVGAGSTSSLDLSSANTPSPTFMPPKTSLVSSPMSEHEEMLFSPPGVPWVDGSSPCGGSSRAASPLGPGGVEARRSSLASPQALMTREGRVRSRSDAPSPSTPIESPSKPMAEAATASDLSSPLTLPTRPPLGSRSNSGNSALIDKMKGVFSKTTSRSRDRSKSLLSPARSAGGDVSEFGGFAIGNKNGTASTTSLLDSLRPVSPSLGPNASLLDLHVGNRKVFLNDTPEQTPRTSISGSGRPESILTSLPFVTPPTSSVSTSLATEPAPSLHIPQPQNSSRNRQRASTVSFATSTPFASTLQPSVPASPSLFPDSATSTPPRRRPSAIKRFSSGLLGSAPSSPKASSGSLFPLPPRSSGSTFSSAQSNLGLEDGMSASVTNILLSPGTSPRPSTGSLPPRNNEAVVKAMVKVEEGETASSWLARVKGLIGREEIAGVLASSGDALHAEALKLYMSQFDFTHNALDVALRRLLMEMSLPKETQQIDRVIEAFAARYEACEPSLFGLKDNAYVLAFSMMMLHTDAFNKHNKNKMTKADYVRNTRLDGVGGITLEYFYDNITYTPFVYVEDEKGTIKGDLGTLSGGRSRSGSDAVSTPGTALTSSGRGTPTTPATVASLSTPRSVTSKVDVYAMIRADLLPSLRVDVERLIPAESPYSCIGTLDMLNMEVTHGAFTGAALLKVGGSPGKKLAIGRRKGRVSGQESESEPEVVLRLTKVGLLSRRDDAHLQESLNSRKSSRKWKSWSVVLTGSQLLFFKDPFWALTVQEQVKNGKRDQNGQIVVTRSGRCVPDEVFPMKDAVAVYDRSYHGHGYVFRFHLPHRQYLMEAANEKDMNEWISLINCSAAFKSSAIRMRSGTMRKDQAQMAGAAAASSFKRDVQSQVADGAGAGPSPKKTFGAARPPSSPARPGSSGRVDAENGAPQSLHNGILYRAGAPVLPAIQTQPLTFPSSAISSVSDLDMASRTQSLDSPGSVSSSPVSGKKALSFLEASESVIKDNGDQLGEVFNVVKAELAAGRGQAAAVLPKDNRKSVNGEVESRKPRVRVVSNQMSRARSIEISIKELQGRLRSAQSHLDTHLTQARNLAILTPFQRLTRERISTVVTPLASRIRLDRMQVAKYSIWIIILQRDLEKELSDFARIRHVALQAAAKSLKDPEGVKGVVDDLNAEDLITHKGVEAMAIPWVIIPGDAEPDRNGHEAEHSLGGSASERETDGSRTDGDDDEADRNGSAHLGSTPQELPILIRRPSSSAGHSRPPFHRHVSAGAPSALGDDDSAIPIKTIETTSTPVTESGKGGWIHPPNRPGIRRSHSDLSRFGRKEELDG